MLSIFSRQRSLDSLRFRELIEQENNGFDPCGFVRTTDLTILGNFISTLSSIIYPPAQAEAITEQKELKTKDEAGAEPSASKTAIFFGTVKYRNNKINIVVKSFKKDPTDTDILGLEYEKKMYEWLSNNILKQRYSPNFVSFLGYDECNMLNWIGGLNMIQKQYIIDTLYGIGLPVTHHKKILNSDILCVMVNEAVGNGGYFDRPDVKGESLFQILASNKLRDIDKTCIYFQIVYNLALLEKFQIMHNDLHTGNIQIAVFNDPIHLLYSYDTNYWFLNTRYIVYFYDWDAGYNPALGNNPKLEDPSFLSYGEENKFQKSSDFCVFACYAHDNHRVFDISGINTDENKHKNNVTPYLVSTQQIDELRLIPNQRVDHIKGFIVYTLNGNELQTIFPNMFSRTITKIELRISSSNRHVYIHSGHTCRNFIEDTRYISPLELLEIPNDANNSPFPELRFAGGRELPEDTFEYKFPTQRRVPMLRPPRRNRHMPY